MRVLAGALVIGAIAAAQIGPAQAQSQSQSAGQILTAGCADDVRKFCSNVTPGGGRIIACLKQNQYAVSDKCKQAAAQASRMSAGPGQSAAPAAAPPTGSSTSSGDAASALTSAPPATPQASAGSSGASGSKAKPARTSAASVSGKSATESAARKQFGECSGGCNPRPCDHFVGGRLGSGMMSVFCAEAICQVLPALTVTSDITPCRIGSVTPSMPVSPVSCHRIRRTAASGPKS